MRITRAVVLTEKFRSILRFEFAGKKIVVGISRVAEPDRLLHRLNSSGPGGTLGHGYHLHPDGAGLRLSGRRAGLGKSPGSVVAAVDHEGSGLLRRVSG